MEVAFKWLAANPYILLFFVVGGAVLLGKATIKGYGFGMVTSAIIVGAGIAAWASTYGVKMSLDAFTKSLFYYLFMYGVGLRVGPSFINSLKGDGLKFTVLAVFCSVLGLLGCVALAKMWSLPDGAAAGILAGAMTMSAAIGSNPSARNTSPWSSLIWVRMRIPRQSSGLRSWRTRFVRWRKPLSQYPSRRHAVRSSMRRRALPPSSPSRALNASARSPTTNGSSNTCNSGAAFEKRTVDM